ncbi:MAG: M24 family metallopeptidase [Opitutales bacterium]|jgi:Xaa-Pro aminopeptidase
MARARTPSRSPGSRRTRRPAAACPLLYAASDTSADQLYFGRFFAPDAFLAFGPRDNRVAVLNALEYGRALKESSYDTVLRLEEWLKKARDTFPRAEVNLAHVLKLLAREYAVSSFLVPTDFPSGLLEKIRALNLPVAVNHGPLFPQRALKTKDEIRDIREGCEAACAGLAAAERTLRRSITKRNGLLFYDGQPLTSERLRFQVDVACLEAGAQAENTIVAGGDQACDPHCRGSGPLRAGELIIVDVFPRVSSTGYHGDVTRTFFKGRAREPVRALVDAVRRAQKLARKQIRAGIAGATIHRAVQAFFEENHFHTRKKPTYNEGFFHGTGHGLGLEIHEPPRLGPTTTDRLREGMVVTVEPGLYYPGLGGCRIEDVVHVTADGCDLLSDFDYNWELR